MFTEFSLYFGAIALGDYIGQKINKRRIEKLKEKEIELMALKALCEDTKNIAELLKKKLKELEEESMET